MREVIVVIGLVALAVLIGLGLFGDDDEGGSGAGSTRAPIDTVLMVVLEGASPEDLERFALQQNVMPELGKLARESTWFARHWAQSNGTSAAFASLLTGLYSSHHGLGAPTRIGHESLSSSVTLLSEDLSAAGFECLASVASPLFSSEFSGFDQGWAQFECGDLIGDKASRSAEEVVGGAFESFESMLAQSERVFGLFEFADPRKPVLTPEPFVAAALARHLAPFEDELPEIIEYLEEFRSGSADGVAALRKMLIRRRGHPVRNALDAAYAEAQFVYLDEQISRLLDLLEKHDRYDDALIIVTGNQGPSTGRYMSSESGFGVFRLNQMRVPLFVRLPGGGRSQPVQALTQAIDLRATVTDALGLTCADSEGASLYPLLTQYATATAPHECVLFEDSLLGSVAAVDDFWFVQNNPTAGYLPLDESRGELKGSEIPPVPKAMLQRTRSVLHDFVGVAQVEVRLAAGSQQEMTIRMPGIDGYWINGRLNGAGARDVHSKSPNAAEPTTWGRRVEQGVSVALGGAEDAGFELWSESEPASFAVAVQVSEGELDESKIQFGDRKLTRLALPRVPDQRAGEWPVDAEGSALPAIVDVTRESGRWLKVHIGGEPGQKVSLLLAGQPLAAADWAKLKVRQSGQNETQTVVGRPDCMWVDGETPMSISVEVPATWGFGISVALEGEQVSVQNMRYLGKRFARPGAIKVAAMSWLPGVREHLESNADSSQRAIEAGTLWIGCRTKRRFANDREVPSPEILARIQRLRDTD